MARRVAVRNPADDLSTTYVWSETNASGIPLPGAVAGWTQVYATDFDTPFSVGGVDASGNFPSPYNSALAAYPDYTPDTTGGDETSFPGADSMYRPSRVLSAVGSKLVIDCHINSTDFPGVPESATFVVGAGVLWQRDEVCFRVPLAGHGFKTAWLLWPDSEVWPTDGEIDFPEGSLSGTIDAFVHWQGGTSGGDQNGFNSGVAYTDTGLGGGWHVAVIERAPVKDSGGTVIGSWVRFALDGVVVGASFYLVPNTSMQWRIQTETDFSNYPTSYATGSDHSIVEIDWLVHRSINGFLVPGIVLPSRTTVFSDAFTGTNGAAISTGNWSSRQTTTGASALVQGNRAQFSSGTVGSYGGIAHRQALVTMPTDFVATFTVRSTDLNECFGRFIFRDANGAAAMTALSAYVIQFEPSYSWIKLKRLVGGSETDLDSEAQTWTTNLELTVEVYCVGSDLQVRVWATSGGTRPDLPTLYANDTTFSTGAYASLALIGGAAATSRTMEFDALTIESVP